MDSTKISISGLVTKAVDAAVAGGAGFQGARRGPDCSFIERSINKETRQEVEGMVWPGRSQVR